LPSLSSFGVTVSMAAFLFSKTVLNWITTYSPSGAPGRLVRYSFYLTSLDFNLPSGFRAAFKDFAKSSLVTAFFR